MMFNIKKSSTK